jgi:hypothetical protein
MRYFLMAAMLLATPAHAGTLPAPRGQPCREQAMGRALDFWIGDWTVTNIDGSKAGTNRVDRLMGGCAVVENWHGVVAGDDGMSLFTYDARRHTWDQIWVTPDTARAGGLKHKTMTGILYAGAVRFEGKIVAHGGTIIDRTTLTPWRDGRVRHTIEWSKDGGKSWQTVFDAFYNRKSGPDLGARPVGDPR